MSTYKIQFSTQDEYEAWVRGAGERIDVLTIRHTPAGATSRAAEGPVVVKYRTGDRRLAARQGNSMGALRIAVALVMLAVIAAFAAGQFQTPAPQAHLLRLDNSRG